ncbi:MAG: sugar-binding protein [Victivallales bacterium]
MRRNRIVLLTVALAAALFPLAMGAQDIKPEPTTITVDPFTDYAVNGVGTIQDINGLVVNGESRLEHANETRELNASTLRLYVWVDPLGIKWEDLKKMKYEDVMAKWNAIDFDKAVPEFFDRMLSIDPKTGRRIPQPGYCAQFWQLEQLQAWNTRKNIVLHFISPHPMTDADFPAFSKYFNACTREVKKRYPDLGPLFVMIFNEPDYEYPRNWEKKSISESVDFFNRFYNHIDTGLNKEFPDVTLIGPGISGFQGWACWKNWTVPFLKQAPKSNFFNCQPYCWRFTDLLSWTEMLQAESLKINGKRLPLITTETNVDLGQPAADWWKDEHHAQRVPREASALFGMMAHPDQFAMKHYFFYHYTCHWHDMWFRHDGVNEPAPVYWLYWLMRDVHGARVLDSVSRESSPLKVISARNGQEVLVAVFNESESPAAAKLQVLWPDGIVEPSGVSEYLRYDPSAKKFLHGVETLPRLPERLILAPGEIRKMRWVYSPSAKIKAKAFEEKQFYAGETGIAVEGSEKQLPVKARKADAEETVRLRLSFYLDDVLSVDRISWSVNGHDMEVKYSPDESGKVQPIVHVDCVIPNEWVSESNTIEFKPVNATSYRIMFAALVFRPQPKSFPAYTRQDALLKRQSPVDITMTMPSLVEPGEIELSLKAVNNTDSPLKGKIGLVVPEGWTVKNPPGEVDMSAKSTSSIAVGLVIPPGGMRGERFVTATLSAPNQPNATTRRGAAFHIPFQAEYAEKTPSIDGAVDEWNPSAFVVEEHKGPGVAPFTSRFAAKWDEKNIYLALDVKGRKLDPVPAGQLQWNHDTFEIFLDFWNSKKPLRDQKCMQTWIALKDLAANKAIWENAPNDPNGCFVKGSSPESYKVKVVEREDGFSMEAALDWESLTASAWLPANERFIPKPGLTLGCEAAISSRSLIGAAVKHYATPSKWGNLKLLAKGEKAAMPDAAIILDSTPKANEKADSSETSAPLFKFDLFDSKEWRIPSGAAFDEAGLHIENNQSILLLNKPIRDVMTEKGIETSITIGGFEKKGDSKEKLRTHARIFLTPLKLEGFIEPYGMSDMICLVAQYVEGDDVSLQLYGKSAPGDNWGKCLWTGTVSASQFPITVSLRISSTDYKVRCDKPLSTTGGSLSGHHQFQKEKWSGDVRFGVKSCYGTRPGEVIVKSIEIR